MAKIVSLRYIPTLKPTLRTSSRVTVRSQFQRSTFPRVLNSYSRLASTMAPKVSSNVLYSNSLILTHPSS
jgi:hypothetical protein